MCRPSPTTSPLPLVRRLRVGSGPTLDGHFVASLALVALIIRNLMAASPLVWPSYLKPKSWRTC